MGVTPAVAELATVVAVADGGALGVAVNSTASPDDDDIGLLAVIGVTEMVGAGATPATPATVVTGRVTDTSAGTVTDTVAADAGSRVAVMVDITVGVTGLAALVTSAVAEI